MAARVVAQQACLGLQKQTCASFEIVLQQTLVEEQLFEQEG
jgi:hypothetical protein